MSNEHMHMNMRFARDNACARAINTNSYARLSVSDRKCICIYEYIISLKICACARRNRTGVETRMFGCMYKPSHCIWCATSSMAWEL